MSNAQNNETEQQARVLSFELLEMLGQFETQDEYWLENEMNQSASNTLDAGIDEQENISEKINE